MHNTCGKGRDTDREVFRTFWVGRAVLYPFAAVGDDGLTCGDIRSAGTRGDAEQTLQDNRIFIKLGSLAWFKPSARASHARDADCIGIGVHPSDELLDNFRFIACGLYESRSSYESWHGKTSLLFILQSFPCLSGMVLGFAASG